ncbi:MAG: hypothetical protein ABR576_03525 [Thermoanaerobaculia bacterium]
MLASLILWAALLAVFLGLVCLIRPLRFLRLRPRRAGAVLLVVGVACAAATALWPARERHSGGSLRIDRFMPVFHFYEHHEIRIRAGRDEVFRAIREVTPPEVRSLGNLMRIRTLPARILGLGARRPPPSQPILDIATGSSFLYLADEPPEEIVLGTAGQFWKASGTSVRVASPEEFLALSDPAVARAVMNFAVTDEGEGWSRVTTETRIAAPSPATRRRFAAYWRLIYPGSSIIRYGWLRAIQRRAEAARSMAFDPCVRHIIGR